MPRALKHFLTIVLFLIAAGCSSGGCGSGCSSCGVTPLPGGFDPQARIENGASVRVTDSGLQFLHDNLGTLAKGLLGGNGTGVLTFGVPTTSGSKVIDYEVCPGGPNANANPPKCTAEVDAGSANLSISATGPHSVHIAGTLPVRLQNLPVHIKYLCTFLGCIESDVGITLNGNGACPGDDQSYAQVPLDVVLSIEADTNMQHSRYGYSKIKAEKLDIDKNALQDAIHICGGFDAWIIDALKGIILPQLVDPLIGTLKDQVDQQLCQKSDATQNPPCPTGTNDVDGICRYGLKASDECASTLLGTDGHVNLGQLLASISPGTKGGLDFALVTGGASTRDDGSGFAWGDLNPVNGGATLGMYGGAEPQPISGCVPFSDLKLPTGIPIPDELTLNTVQDWPSDKLAGPHVGFALSERFANYALNGIYNSGLLCIGIGTDQVAMLNTGTLGLLAPSMKDLGLQREPQQVAVVIRPQKPPSATIGNGTDAEKDPVLRIKLPDASFDFYFWSLDRYIRILTATFDLDIPVNLTVTPDGLAPVIKSVGVNNPKVTNNDLLKENPDTVAKALAMLLASQVGQAIGSGIKPVDLGAALSKVGLSLLIPDSVAGKGSPGLKKLTKGSDNYLGIFAALQVAMPITKQAHTTARAIKKTVDPKGLEIATFRDDNAPIVTLEMGSSLDGPEAVEFSYRVDTGTWQPWTRDRIIDVTDNWLRVQAHHTVSVRSRVVGEPMTIDPNPATVDVIVDAHPPVVEVGQVEAENRVKLSVRDLVSRGDAAQVRVKLDGGRWSEWTAASEMASINVGDAVEIAIEARDEEGNVAQTSQALIRGRAAIDAAAGCGCSVPGQSSTNGKSALLLGIAMMGAVLRVARRRRSPSASKRSLARGVRALLIGFGVVGTAASFGGCSCGGDSNTPQADGYICAAPDCNPLPPGLVGAYTSVATSGSDVWFSGYAEADWEDGFSWGDLVVGKWNGTSVDWVAIDGVPSDEAVDEKTYDKNGFRGGQTSPGDDVGLWTSLAVDGLGHPRVAYYDRTHKALKFASFDGSQWTSITVQQKTSSDIGRYAKLVLIDEKPVIAYLAIEGGATATHSGVRLATAASTTPGEADWTFEDVATNSKTPCRDAFCASGTKCIAATGTCEKPASGCMPDCASGTACVKEMSGLVCEKTFDKNKIDSYPEAYGDYVAMALDAKGGVGIAFYDRIHGNVVVASKTGGKWTTSIVDGDDGKTDTGDMGIGLSLAIDDKGAWHLAYVDGLNEQVRYLKITSGKAGTPAVVDDGLSLGGMKFTDGQHIVGDDSHIAVTSSGEVHITYQDATSGKLRHAVGQPVPGGNPKWSLKAYDHEGFGGAFSNQVDVGGQLKLTHWWRMGGSAPHGDVAVLDP